MLCADPKWAACESCNCEDGVSPIARWEIKGVVEADTVCPRRRVTDDDWYLVDLYQHYVAGHLLHAGGIADQPAIYLDAMQEIAAGIRIGRSD